MSHKEEIKYWWCEFDGNITTFTVGETTYKMRGNFTKEFERFSKNKGTFEENALAFYHGSPAFHLKKRKLTKKKWANH